MNRGDAFPQDVILKSHPSNNRLTIFWFKNFQLNSTRCKISEYFPHMYIIKLGINLVFFLKFKKILMLCSFSIFESPTPKSSIGTSEKATIVQCKGPIVQAWVDECFDNWRTGDENLKWSFEGSVSFSSQFSPNFDLKNMISTYRQRNFSWKKMIQIGFEISKRKKKSNHQIFMKHSSK